MRPQALRLTLGHREPQCNAIDRDVPISDAGCGSFGFTAQILHSNDNLIRLSCACCDVKVALCCICRTPSEVSIVKRTHPTPDFELPMRRQQGLLRRALTVDAVMQLADAVLWGEAGQPDVIESARADEVDRHPMPQTTSEGTGARAQGTRR
jgi:hypothetical protein